MYFFQSHIYTIVSERRKLALQKRDRNDKKKEWKVK